MADSLMLSMENNITYAKVDNMISQIIERQRSMIESQRSMHEDLKKIGLELSKLGAMWTCLASSI